ncbi:hypothetical protein PAHAL_9G594800 [Panicum hallii]|uniref:Uncharacterized protein n=1 Tax=Panicum hallii TaxID=206008 RepID=A0A2T8I692_9POAL|nr:hypothetical protein PAHAL_9G594800 [Panicum hallii]
MVRVAAAAVLLLHCCGVMILAARPLVPPAAGEDGGWQLRHGGAGASSILQVLDKSNAPSQPGQGNCDWKDPGHPKGNCPPPPKK